MEERTKRQITNCMQWCVTAASVIWVLQQIDWHDHVRCADGTALRGEVSVRDDHYTVTGTDGVMRIVPFADGELQPGFLALVSNIKPAYLMLGVIVYPWANVLGAIRWRALLQAHQINISFIRCLQLTWLGFFWSLVLPGVTGGDVVKAYSAARSAEKRAASVVTVFFDRLIGLVGLSFLSGVVILLNLRNTELRTVSTGILVFIAVMVGGGLLFFSRRLRRWSGLKWFMSLLPFQAQVTQLDEALFHYRYHKKTLVLALFLSVGTHVVNVGAFYFAGRSLGLEVAWQHYFVFIPVMLMIAALPISVGGLGVLESGVAHFLTLRGVGATASGALALCVLYRIMTVVVGLPGAMVRISKGRGVRYEGVGSRLGDQKGMIGDLSC